jgi:hypothetical protein
MEWFALLLAAAALGMASDSTTRAAGLARRVAALAALCARLEPADVAPPGHAPGAARR